MYHGGHRQLSNEKSYLNKSKTIIKSNALAYSPANEDEDSLFDSDRIEGKRSRYQYQATSRPNLNKLPESLLQRESYLDHQRFASEQEKNNYESTRKGLNYTDNTAMK